MSPKHDTTHPDQAAEVDNSFSSTSFPFLTFSQTKTPIPPKTQWFWLNIISPMSFHVIPSATNSPGCQSGLEVRESRPFLTYFVSTWHPHWSWGPEKIQDLTSYLFLSEIRITKKCWKKKSFLNYTGHWAKASGDTMTTVICPGPARTVTRIHSFPVWNCI